MYSNTHKRQYISVPRVSSTYCNSLGILLIYKVVGKQRYVFIVEIPLARRAKSVRYATSFCAIACFSI